MEIERGGIRKVTIKESGTRFGQSTFEVTHGHNGEDAYVKIRDTDHYRHIVLYMDSAEELRDALTLLINQHKENS